MENSKNMRGKRTRKPYKQKFFIAVRVQGIFAPKIRCRKGTNTKTPQQEFYNVR